MTGDPSLDVIETESAETLGDELAGALFFVGQLGVHVDVTPAFDKAWLEGAGGLGDLIVEGLGRSTQHQDESTQRGFHKLKVYDLMSKIYSRAELVAQRAQWKAEGKKVVFTNGCYDILHPGHVRLLEAARSLGDILILALNTDESVQRLKGPSRPILNEETRARLAGALDAVDAVTFFNEDTPRELIAEVLPDYLVKGADWAHFIAGREEVEAAGGEVKALPLEPGFSTTNLVGQILERHK
jgi:rfaE bifunctional protein nucleotidyltransferase chain/domain